jgi:thiamine-phosphate pyrophosphorylase
VGAKASQLRGFYAVVDVVGGGADPCAAAVQLRLKDAPTEVLVAEARRLRREVGAALLIVNDRVDVALAAGADGVHLGQTDLPLADARAIAGDLIIGISTHDLDQVRAAVAGGADYLGYGPVFATATKENPDPVQGVDALAAAVAAAAPVPVVAIGGITPERAGDVAASGCAAACAIASVNGAPDPAAAARAIAAAFDSARASRELGSG